MYRPDNLESVGSDGECSIGDGWILCGGSRKCHLINREDWQRPLIDDIGVKLKMELLQYHTCSCIISQL